ncbi:methyl-accepting chemotaxis protein [Vibrio navarrensis]|uniref:methyl-accepting chemotaxis protein n=1 Tax=Vibrio navarrensis TaxID=29495 RepID=UPI001869F618|nr:methyl-accepting chemotaxis protein [Vibrio navarrensis]MBE4608241.1 methyl-accepting chemotaxis protein [Vibrio navarrensis]MBE4611705.1 methyl-accepting chemotaxis protein [Vibrio navarrensis]
MKWLNNLTITQKMSSLVGALLSLIIVVSAFAVTKMEKVALEIDSIANNNIPLTKVVTDLTVHQLESAVMLEKLLRSSQILIKSVVNEQATYIEKLRQETESANADLAQAIQSLKLAANQDLAPEMQRYLSELSHDFQVLQQEQGSFQQQLDRFLNDAALGVNSSELTDKAADLDELETKLNSLTEVIAIKIKDATEKSVNLTLEEEQEAIQGMMLVSAFGLVVGSVLGLLMSKQIVKSVAYARNLAYKIAHGDLTQRAQVDSKDEIGQLLTHMNSMAQALESMVGEVIDRANTIASTVTQLTAVADSNRRSVERQQQNMDQVASAMHQMAASITEVASSAEEATTSTARADENAKHTCVVISQTQSLSKQLVESAQSSQKIIEELQTSTQQIQNFVMVVEGIAEQTNLLALNAAIEAARAGEQGRGFAVVADEVRALASRSQHATQEIGNLINTLVARAGTAVAMIHSSDEKIESSFASIEEAKVQLDVISNALAELTEANTQVAAASEEQAVSAEEISSNLNGIRDAGEVVMLSTQETSQASEDLAQQAQALKMLMGRFVVKQSM